MVVVVAAVRQRRGKNESDCIGVQSIGDEMQRDEAVSATQQVVNLTASLLACLLAPRADLLNFLYTRVEQTNTHTHSYTPVIFTDLNNFMYLWPEIVLRCAIPVVCLNYKVR